MAKQSTTSMPKDLYLVVSLLYEKLNALSNDGNRSSISDKDYRKMINWYEQAIDADEKTIQSPLSFALLYNLHENKKHKAAAMSCVHQFNDVFDKNPELEQMWNQMLDQIKEKQTISQFDICQNSIIKMIDAQNRSETISKEEIQKIVASLLFDKISELQKMNTNRSEIKADEAHLKNDENTNRIMFYKKMRTSLSNKFTAMAITSGDSDDEPIVKHDRMGTLNK
jgi:hypothetical protein